MASEAVKSIAEFVSYGTALVTFNMWLRCKKGSYVKPMLVDEIINVLNDAWKQLITQQDTALTSLFYGIKKHMPYESPQCLMFFLQEFFIIVLEIAVVPDLNASEMGLFESIKNNNYSVALPLACVLIQKLEHKKCEGIKWDAVRSADPNMPFFFRKQ